MTIQEELDSIRAEARAYVDSLPWWERWVARRWLEGVETGLNLVEQQMASKRDSALRRWWDS